MTHNGQGPNKPVPATFEPAPQKHQPKRRWMNEVDPVELGRLGHAIRRRRHALRLSQEKAGLRSGLHRNYIGALERGEVNPTYATLLRLSDGLRMPIDVLIADAQRCGTKRRSGR